MNEVIGYSEKMNDSKGVAIALNNKSVISLNKGQHEKAFKQSKISVAIIEPLVSD